MVVGDLTGQELLDQILDLKMAEREVKIQELRKLEDFLMSHGRIKRRAVISRSMAKKGFDRDCNTG